jgi:hypothetical protein
MQNITREEVNAICRKNGIAPQHYRCFWGLLLGRGPRDEFGERLYKCRNYKEATKALFHATGPAVAPLREELWGWVENRTSVKVAPKIVADVFITLADRDVRNPRLAHYTMASRRIAG